MFWKSQNKNQQSFGFTLIELLVASALGLVTLAGSLAAYSSFNSQQTHIQVSRNVIANIEQIQKRATVGDQPEGCNSLEGYQVSAAANSSSYLLSIFCDGDLTTAVETKQYTLPSEFSFRQDFSVFYRPYPYDVASSDQVVEIQRSNSSRVYRFRILQRGAVEDLGMINE